MLVEHTSDIAEAASSEGFARENVYEYKCDATVQGPSKMVAYLRVCRGRPLLLDQDHILHMRFVQLI